MSLVTESFTIGTAIERIVPGLHYSQDVIVQNLEPENSSAEYAKDGYLYTISQRTTVASPGTAIFELVTGPEGLQIDSYQIVSNISSIEGQLIEDATVTTSGSAVSAYNLNRNESDTTAATFTPGTAVTGGTTVAREYITADKHAAAGDMTSGKIFTLKPSTTYALTFTNLGNQTTQLFFQMLFSEKYNGQNRVTVGDENGNGFTLRGGAFVQMRVDEGQSLYAVAENSADIVIVRQN